MLTDILDLVGLVAIAFGLAILLAGAALWLGVLAFGVFLLFGSWLVDALPAIIRRLRR